MLRYGDFGNKIYNDIVTPPDKPLTVAAAVLAVIDSVLAFFFSGI